MNQPPPRRPLTSRRPVSPPRRSVDPRLLLGGGGAALALVLLAVLFIGPCSILNPSDDADETRFECPTIKNPPPPPNGLEVSSIAKDFSDGRCNKSVPPGPSAITLPLESGKGGRGLALYTYTGEKWQRLAPAELTEDGKAARAVVDRVPANGAIMRRAPGAFQLMGVVPQGQTLTAEAERLAAIVGGADFIPAADGAVNGSITNIKRNETALLVPIVRATAGAEVDAVNAFLADATRRAAHAATIGRLVTANRLDGIELQYTAVDPARRGDFTELVRAVTDEVRKAGGLVILTLPLPVKDGTNWNTGAYDWSQLGKLADLIKIAPELDQSLYRRTVPEALTYLTTQVEPRQLVLTVSPLAAEKSDQGIRTLSTLDALSLAAQFTIRDRERAAGNQDVVIVADNLNDEGGAAGGINWDALTATVAFTYRAGEQARTVWIENQYSAAFKAEYATLWKLGGIAVDDASSNAGLANIWPALTPLSDNQPLALIQPNSGLLKPEWLVDNRPFQAGRPVVTWKTPVEGGNHTITLIVSDGVMRVQSMQRITLRPGNATAPGAAASPSPSPRAGATVAPSPTPRR